MFVKANSGHKVAEAANVKATTQQLKEAQEGPLLDIQIARRTEQLKEKLRIAKERGYTTLATAPTSLKVPITVPQSANPATRTLITDEKSRAELSFAVRDLSADEQNLGALDTLNIYKHFFLVFDTKQPNINDTLNYIVANMGQVKVEGPLNTVSQLGATISVYYFRANGSLTPTQILKMYLLLRDNFLPPAQLFGESGTLRIRCTTPDSEVPNSLALYVELASQTMVLNNREDFLHLAYSHNEPFCILTFLLPGNPPSPLYKQWTHIFQCIKGLYIKYSRDPRLSDALVLAKAHGHDIQMLTNQWNRAVSTCVALVNELPQQRTLVQKYLEDIVTRIQEIQNSIVVVQDCIEYIT